MRLVSGKWSRQRLDKAVFDARGTIGGSIANADPAADYPAAVVGLAATVQTNTRSIAADDFFTGLFETADTGGP